MPVMPDAAVLAAGPHDQADAGAEHRALCVGASLSAKSRATDDLASLDASTIGRTISSIVSTHQRAHISCLPGVVDDRFILFRPLVIFEIFLGLVHERDVLNEVDHLSLS
jgi:hypothetical protein